MDLPPAGREIHFFTFWSKNYQIWTQTSLLDVHIGPIMATQTNIFPNIMAPTRESGWAAFGGERGEIRGLAADSPNGRTNHLLHLFWPIL